MAIFFCFNFFFFFKQKTAYEMIWWLEFRRVLFRSTPKSIVLKKISEAIMKCAHEYVTLCCIHTQNHYKKYCISRLWLHFYLFLPLLPTIQPLKITIQSTELSDSFLIAMRVFSVLLYLWDITCYKCFWLVDLRFFHAGISWWYENNWWEDHYGSSKVQSSINIDLHLEVRCKIFDNKCVI